MLFPFNNFSMKIPGRNEKNLFIPSHANSYLYRILIFLIFIIFLSLNFIGCAGKNMQTDIKEAGGIIDKDTVWTGNIIMIDDVIVLKKARLTIMPGTTIKIQKSPHTKVEPQFYNNEYELIIRGKLQAIGKKNKQITFSSFEDNPSSGDWTGIIFENSPKDNAFIYCNIYYAETALNIINSSVQVKDCSFEKNIYAITVLNSRKGVKLQNNNIKNNKYGIYSLFTSRPLIKNNIIENNKEEGIYYNVDSFPLLEKNVIKNNKYNIRFISK